MTLMRSDEASLLYLSFIFISKCIAWDDLKNIPGQHVLTKLSNDPYIA